VVVAICQIVDVVIACNSCNISSNGCGCGCGGFGSSNWFAIVLVVFLLLIICGNSRIRVG